MVLGKFIYWEGSGTLNSANNMNIPGSRNEAAYVQFPDGKLGVSGGFSPYNGYLKDQWKWNPYYGSAGRWEFFSGPKSYNELGYSNYNSNREASPVKHGSRHRHGAFYTSNNGFALFGGFGYDSGKELNPSPIITSGNFTQSLIDNLNDYWRGNGFTDGSPFINDRGDANHPSARLDFAYVTDKSGDHWIFGGNGVSNGTTHVGTGWNLNDFWNVTEGKLVSGTNVGGNTSPIYGTTGQESQFNRPGSRSNAVMWCDGNGYIWLFGGWGMDITGNQGRLNDLWRYNPETGYWAFMRGSYYRNQNGIYNQLGVADAASCPGGRNRPITAVDQSGNLWLYGGYGMPASGSETGLADLWHYNVSTNVWTWMGGVNYGGIGPNPNWNYKGTYNSGAFPGTRWEGGAAVDTNDVLWFFGGNNGNGQCDDLWKMQLNARAEVSYLKQDSSIFFILANNSGTSVRKGTNYGIAKLNGTIHRKTYTIRNTSVGILKFGAIRAEISGTDAADFKIVKGPKRTLKFGETTQITVEFKPQTAGIKSAALKIYTNSATNSTFQLNLKGRAISDELSFEQWNWVHGAGTHYEAGYYVSGDDKSGYPGSRYYDASCVDDLGRLWIWGGFGNASSSDRGWLNDLWVYDSRTGTWEWVSGSNTVNQAAIYGTKGTGSNTNRPSGKQNPNMWYHNGFIYIFGGYGDMDNVTSYSNEFWRYEISSSEWTWLGGGNQGAYYGVYTASTPANNHPGSRMRAANFAFDGKLYLFGGYGYASTGGIGYLNDLWEYDPSTGNWSHISGKNIVNQLGTYGGGSSDPNNIPGGRQCKATVDDDGNAYFFGGYGYASSGGGYLNDLWKYEISTGKWTWVSGNDLAGQSPIHGTVGTPTATTVPGGRYGVGVLCDEVGDIWVFGGRGIDSEKRIGFLNDLWHFDVNSEKWTWEGGETKGYLDQTIYAQDFQDGNRGLELTEISLNGTNTWWRADYNGNYYAEINGYGDNANSEDWLITPSLDLSAFNYAEITFRNVSNYSGGTFQVLVSTNWDGTTSGLSSATWTDLSSNAYFSQGNWESSWTTLDLSNYISTNTYVAWYYTGSPTSSRTQQIDDIAVRGVQNYAKGNYSFTGSASSSAYPAAKAYPYFLMDNSGGFILGGGQGVSPFTYNNAHAINDLWYYRPSGGYIWDGGNNSWATGGNWESSNTPDSTVTILVPAGKSNYPVISSTTAVKNLYVAENASITINSNQVLRVKGDLNLRGTVSGSGTILLCGNSTQKVQTGRLGNVRIRMESGDLNLTEDLEITGLLALKRGDIVLGDNNLTLSGTTNHGSSKSYIKINGSGKVKATVGSTPVIIPVGRNPYLPVVIDDGGNAEFSVGLANGVFENPETQATEITTNSVSETWTVGSDANVSNVSITLGWHKDEELNNFARGNSFIAYWVQGSSQWNSLGYTSATGSDPDYFIQSTMGSMTAGTNYYFSVGSAGSPLPVDLTFFTAKWHDIDKNMVALNWQTASEINNSHFEIERSFNGVDFEAIGVVNGNGTTYKISTYEFLDDLSVANGLANTVYYRLKQVDFDGKFDYSEIRVLSSEAEGLHTFNIWPNPANTGWVQFSSVGNYAVYSLQGVLLKQIQNQSSLDISDFDAGTYIIRSESGYSLYFIVQP